MISQSSLRGHTGVYHGWLNHQRNENLCYLLLPSPLMRHQISVNETTNYRLIITTSKSLMKIQPFSDIQGIDTSAIPEEGCWLETNIPPGGYSNPPVYRPTKSEKYLLVKGLKSLSRPSSAELTGRSLTQQSKVQIGLHCKVTSRTDEQVLVLAGFI